jgi:hypothetical protein
MAVSAHVIVGRVLGPELGITHLARPVSNCIHVLTRSMPVDKVAVAGFAFIRHREALGVGSQEEDCLLIKSSRLSGFSALFLPR